MTVDTIGRRIARRRREIGVELERDLSVGDVAKMVGTDYTTVYNWEKDAKKPAKLLGRLSEVLGVTPAYIIYGSLPKDVPGWALPALPVEEAPRETAKKKRGKRADAALKTRGRAAPKDKKEKKG